MNSTSVCSLGLFVCLAATAFAAVDVEPFEQLIQQGKPEEAMTLLAKELERRPEHPRLLYNYGVAAYAAGKYDEALLAFDKVDSSRNGALVEKARKQKGNAEFHLGLQAKASNLDETIERWKTSLGHYKMALKNSPNDAMAKGNHEVVTKLLMDLLLKNADQHLEKAHQKWMQGEQKIEELRSAMEKFQEAKRVDETSEPAQQGERQAREELAQELAKQGERKAQKPGQVTEWAVREMQKGVNQLEDANRLVPEHKPIEQKLDQARQNLADALTQLAQQQLDQGKTAKWERERFDKLEKAIDNAEGALEQKPEHQEAARVLEQAKDELAKAHEQKGDQEMRDAERAPLQRAANQLENALEDYRQAEQLKPQDANLAAKALNAQTKLEDALQRLADRMMQAQPRETLDDKANRLETAEEALQDLEQLKPSEKTEQQLADAQNQLRDVRQELAALAKDRPQPSSQPEPESAQAPTARREPAPDFEKMPHLKQQPLGKGDFKSDSMNRKGKDY
ncbi:MAG: tetratricopeptide repeat protein [Verrucomicrobia bacterium]|nr:tetratricopeptide repeat protein [Verrucomicrobiota bacterium]